MGCPNLSVQVSKETHFVEKRRYPRQLVSDRSPLEARLILSGGSLIQASSPRSIEIGARPLDLSQGGICLSLQLDVPWETLTPKKEVSLLLTLGEESWLLPATVVRHEKKARTLGLQFSQSLASLTPFLTPPELQ